MAFNRGAVQKCILACLLVVGGLYAADDYSTWTSSGTIILNTTSAGANVATNQIGFPVLVKLTSANAANVFTTANSAGADIRFSKANGTAATATHLPYEMIKWDAAAKKAFFWVLLDTVYGNSTQTIKIYWNKAGAVDSSNGAAVFSAANNFIANYHLNKALADSSNGMHLFKDASGTMANAYGGTTVTDTDAIIDRGRAFHQIGAQAQDNNSGDSVVIPGMMGKPKTLTFSAWVRVDSIDQYNQSVNGHRANIVSLANIASLNDAGADGTGIDSFYMGFKGAGNWNNYGYYKTTGPTLLKQGWQYVAGTINPAAGYAAIYLNGDSVAGFASTDSIAWGNSGNTKLGKQGTTDYGEKLGGSLCEVRFENVARSAAWQRLCFQNQGATDNLVTVVTTPVTAPLLTTPANGSTNLVPPVTLGWAPYTNATSYTVQVSTGSGFVTTVVNAAGVTGTSTAASGLAYNATYFWRVNALAGSTTGWSSVWSFATLVPPQAPAMTSPTNGSINAPGVTLTWQSAATATTYGVRVSTSSGFASTVLNQSSLTTRSAAFTGAAGTTYYWQANAANAAGTGSWSTAWSFSVPSLPVAPALSSPSNGAASSAPAGNLTLSWSTVAGALTYTLQVSTTSSFGSTLFFNSAVTGTSRQLTGLTNKTYYWHMADSSIAGSSPWSTTWSFSISSLTLPGKAMMSTAASLSVKSSFVDFSMPVAGAVSITFTDIMGRTVFGLSRIETAGMHRMSIDRLGLAPGRYIVRMKTASFEKKLPFTLAR